MVAGAELREEQRTSASPATSTTTSNRADDHHDVDHAPADDHDDDGPRAGATGSCGAAGDPAHGQVRSGTSRLRDRLGVPAAAARPEARPRPRGRHVRAGHGLRGAGRPEDRGAPARRPDRRRGEGRAQELPVPAARPPGGRGQPHRDQHRQPDDHPVRELPGEADHDDVDRERREFCYITPKKAPTQRVCEVATTPNGRYTYYFFYDGWQDGDLGELYNPYYFFKGRAIHGYDSVPAEPASHGCSRIPMHIATYWHTLVHRGDAVYVDGGPYNEEQIISSEPI